VWPSSRAVDPERYLVLPFRQRGLSPPPGLSGRDYARLTWQALSRQWRDLRLVDEAVVEDRLQSTRDSLLTLSRGLELARELGAGLLVWGEIEQLGDSIELRAAVYRTDRNTENAVQRGEAVLPASNQELSAREIIHALRQLAQGLVLPELAGSPDQETLIATPYFEALRATLSGDSALVNWNLALAREKYRAAMALDHQYAAPRLHFARASLWADEPPSEWQPAARLALASRSGVSALERLEAEGLVALGEGDFPRACDRFRALIARDSLLFAGWFGLGECLTRDSIVAPDPASPSGWRFRGSIATGTDAYFRALRLVPLSHVAYGGSAAFARLADKLHAETNRFRLGVAGTHSPQRFAALQGLDGDSITTIPYPIEAVLSGTRVPSSHHRALELNRRRLLTLTSEWLARYPQSPSAIEAHALALELSGEVGALPSNSPLSLVHRLRVLDVAFTRKIELGAWEVRLRLKARQYTAARLLADSLLQLAPTTKREFRLAVGLAALTGRVYRAAELAAVMPERLYVLPSGTIMEVPTGVASASQCLLIYAAAGAPAESTNAAMTRLQVLVEREVERGRRESVLEAVLFQPRLLGFPDLQPPAGALEITRIESAIANREPAVARQVFQSLAENPARQLSNIPPDHLLLEARLLLLLGDTAQAQARLAPILDNPATLGIDFLEWASQAIALPRALGLFRALGSGIRTRAVDSALAALLNGADLPWRTGPKQ
jgi:hypothetical protein